MRPASHNSCLYPESTSFERNIVMIEKKLLSERVPVHAATVKFQSGFSLVELMVAMVLGLFLSAAVAAGYLTTKRTYQTTQQVSRIQENSRFAIHFLGKAIRNAGNFGCVDNIRNHVNSDIFDFSKPVMGWNFNGTNQGNVYSLPAPGATAALSEWSQTNGPSSDLPALLAPGGVNRAIPGSDVILVQGLSPPQDIILTGNATNSNTIGATSATGGGHGVPADTIVIISNCYESAERYQTNQNENADTMTRANNNDNPGNVHLSNNVWATSYGAESSFFYDTSAFYYLGRRANSVMPSLFKLPIGDQGTTGTPIELVEGVQNMQIIYGEDVTDDRVVDRYVSADEIINWSNVISVRIALIVRSISDNAVDKDHNKTFTLLDNIGVKLAAGSDDRVLRYPVQTTIRLRNSGLFKDTKSCTAVGNATQCP